MAAALCSSSVRFREELLPNPCPLVGAVRSRELGGLKESLRSIMDPETEILDREERTLLPMALRGVLERANLRSDWLASCGCFFLVLGRVVGDVGADRFSRHSVVVLNLSLSDNLG